MFLNNIQIAKILTLILFSIILLLHQNDFGYIINYFTPPLQTENNAPLANTLLKYKQLEAEKYLYIERKKVLKSRSDNYNWIVSNLLYTKAIKNKDKKTLSKSVRKESWVLEILYPKQKTAIINSKILKVGQYVNGALLVKVEYDRALLKTKKGQKWVYLFQ